MAVPIADSDAERLARVDWNDENRLLYELLKSPAGRMGSWTRAWTTLEGEPQNSKFHQLLEALSVVAKHCVWRGRERS